MSRDEDIVRLRHMLDAARKAMEFTQGRSRADLDADEMLELALIRLLEVLAKPLKAFPWIAVKAIPRFRGSRSRGLEIV